MELIVNVVKQVLRFWTYWTFRITWVHIQKANVHTRENECYGNYVIILTFDPFDVTVSRTNACKRFQTVYQE